MLGVWFPGPDQEIAGKRRGWYGRGPGLRRSRRGGDSHGVDLAKQPWPGFTPGDQQRWSDRVDQCGSVHPVAQCAGRVEGKRQDAAEPQQVPGPAELAVGVAVQREEPYPGEQADDAQIDRRRDQPRDPRGDAKIEAEPGDIAEAERERHDDDRGGNDGHRAACQRLTRKRGTSLT